MTVKNKRNFYVVFPLVFCVLVSACIVLYIAVKWRSTMAKPATLGDRAAAETMVLLDGRTLESLHCTCSGISLADVRLKPGECPELIDIFRNLVRNGMSLREPYFRDASVTATLGTDRIGFCESLERPESRFAIWLVFGPSGRKYPDAVDIVKLAVDYPDGRTFVMKTIPLEPALLRRIKDAVDQAKKRQVEREKRQAE
jgi:hypothetical protein